MEEETKKKPRLPVASFYIEPEKIKKFDSIVKREGSNRSKKLNEFINEYIMQHEKGNPQLLMVHYVKPDAPQPLRVLCIYCQGALSDGRVWCNRSGMWVPSVKCYSCKYNRLRKRS